MKENEKLLGEAMLCIVEEHLSAWYKTKKTGWIRIGPTLSTKSIWSQATNPLQISTVQSPSYLYQTKKKGNNNKTEKNKKWHCYHQDKKIQGIPFSVQV